MIATRYTDALAGIAQPSWLVQTRHAALNRFLALGLPDARLEEWKHTSLGHLEKTALHAPAPETGEAVCPNPARYPGHALVFQDGRLACHGTYLSNQFAGTLHQFGDTRPAQQHLGSLAGEGALASLNLALWQDGVRIYVPAGERIELPVFAVYGAAEPEAMVHPRNLVVLERDSEALLVEHYLGQTEQNYWHNPVSEIVLDHGARLTHVRVIDDGPAATHTGLSAVRLGRGSEYRALYVGLGGRLARHDLIATLAGDRAAIHIDALDLADGRRHADLHLRIFHQAAETTSRIAYRGLAGGRAQAVFDGHVVVGHDAHQTDAKQACRGLLLSPHAEIDAMPRLEIYADDVKCGHGASVGQLDQDAIFYLMSRGIDEPTARRLLLESFTGVVLGLLDEAHLRDWLMPRLLAALPKEQAK